MAFCLGTLAGHTALVVMPSSALPLSTLLLSWTVVSALAGAPFASTNQWLSFAGSAAIHGRVASIAYVGLSRLARRWRVSGERPEWLLTLLGVVHVVALMVWRVSDWS